VARSSMPFLCRKSVLQGLTDGQSRVVSNNRLAPWLPSRRKHLWLPGAVLLVLSCSLPNQGSGGKAQSPSLSATVSPSPPPYTITCQWSAPSGAVSYDLWWWPQGEVTNVLSQHVVDGTSCDIVQGMTGTSPAVVGPLTSGTWDILLLPCDANNAWLPTAQTSVTVP